MPTRLGDEIDHVIHATDRDQQTPVADMARLPARLTPALGMLPAFTLPAREPIGGRGLRGRDRVLPAKCQLPLQIRDTLRLFGNLTVALSEFPSQTLHFPLQPFLVVGPWPSLGARHAHTVRRSDQFVQPPELLRGLVSLVFVHSRGWFEIYTSSSVRGVGVSAVIATLFGAWQVCADLLVTRFPKDINVPPPQSLLFYPWSCPTHCWSRARIGAG